MKIRLHQTFRYQKTATEVVELLAGVHDLPKELAEKAIRFGGAKLVTEKKAPENKVVGVPENKAKVAKVRSRRSRAKPKS